MLNSWFFISWIFFKGRGGIEEGKRRRKYKSREKIRGRYRGKCRKILLNPLPLNLTHLGLSTRLYYSPLSETLFLHDFIIVGEFRRVENTGLRGGGGRTFCATLLLVNSTIGLILGFFLPENLMNLYRI